jgi:hypothetical protein
MTGKVFLSYARANADFALRLGRDLRSAGVDLWIDQLDIPPGVPWDRAVQEALEACPTVLVILTPESVSSRSVMDEVSYALEENKRTVPVLYRSCRVPFQLRRLQYIDFTSDYAAGLSQLSQLLSLQEQTNDKHAKHPVPWWEWFLSGRKMAKLTGAAAVGSLGLVLAVRLVKLNNASSGEAQSTQTATEPRGAQDLGGNQLKYAPSAVAGPQGEITVFFDGPSSHLWRRSWTSQTGWSAPTDLGEPVVTSAPSVVSSGRHDLDAFYKGGNEHLWTSWLDGSTWSSADLGGVPLGSGPSAITGGQHRLDVFYVGPNRHLWTSSWDGGQWWSAPTDLGGVELNSAPAAISRGSKRMDVFYRGPNGHLWTSWWDGQWWSAPTDLGGVQLNSAPAAIPRGPERTDVFYRGPNDHLWTSWWDGAQWSAPTDLGGIPLASSPSAVGFGTQRIEVFYKGHNGRLWKSVWNGGPWWSAPIEIVSEPTSGPNDVSTRRKRTSSSEAQQPSLANR